MTASQKKEGKTLKDLLDEILEDAIHRELDRGGHFAAWETGRLFADEVMSFVKKIKG